MEKETILLFVDGGIVVVIDKRRDMRVYAFDCNDIEGRGEKSVHTCMLPKRATDTRQSRRSPKSGLVQHCQIHASKGR